MKNNSHPLHPNVIQQALSRIRARIGCFAAAFVAHGTKADEVELHFDCSSSQDGTQARRMIQQSGKTFFTLCSDKNDVVIRNRVRDSANGPLLCRFMIVPARDSSGEALGVFVLYNHADGVEFSESDAQMAVRLSRTFSKAVSLPRDPLTKLLSRAGFERAVARLRSGASRESGALLYGDIDQVHVINDLWGFEIGDAVIAHIGNELRTIALSCDAAASRLSGDRFTIFIPNCGLERAKELAERLRTSVAASRFMSNTQPVPLSMSWGVAPLPPHDTTLDHGLAAAEVACKAAKDRGRNRVEVYQDTDASIIRRRDDMLIVGRLRTCLQEGRFQVFGQPIARLLPGDTTRRYEMLVRLIDEKDKLVLPQQFMSSATRYQLLPQLDRHVIEHVLNKLREAKSVPGFQPLQVSINLSGPTISEAHFADWLVEQVSNCGVPASWIGFELTETAAIANLERAQMLIERLGAMGCKFALDDFGTGVSSLAYLKDLKLSMIKIDGSFIRGLLENERAESLVRGIAQLAHSMGIETVAEYVETPMLCMRLIDLGVQFGQGYALGYPVLLDRILDPIRSMALAS
jgi:diguanylate cyclase (GGDEF)-like protein